MEGRSACASTEDTQFECDDALLAKLASGSATVEDVTRALASGWEPNRAELETGDTPLHLAARSASLRVCQVLVAAGANPSARNKRNTTPGGQRGLGSREVADYLRAAEAAAAAASKERWGQRLQASQTASACAVQTL